MNERERDRKGENQKCKEWLFVPNCDKFIRLSFELDCKKSS